LFADVIPGLPGPLSRIRLAICIQATNVCIATIHFIHGNRNGKVNARSNLIGRCEFTT